MTPEPTPASLRKPPRSPRDVPKGGSTATRRVVFRLRGGRRIRIRRLRDLGLDAGRDVGKRGRAVGRGELDAVVFGGIVRGREVDATRGAEAPDREGDDGRRHVAVRAEGAHAFADEDAGRLVDEPLVQETCVGREDDCGRRIPRNPHRARDGGDDASRIRERELFPQNRAPAGSTETDHQAVGFYGAEARNGAWKFRGPGKRGPFSPARLQSE